MEMQRGPMTRTQYDKLILDGAFDESARVELIFGRIVGMSPIDQAHVESIRKLHEILLRKLRSRARVYAGAPFAASRHSEPEPDLMVTAEATWDDHPKTAILLVEVARTSLYFDRTTKAFLYGLSNVDEYWIVDHVNELVEVRRDRRRGRWRTVTQHRRGETIVMADFPDVKVRVSDILRPVKKRRRPKS